MVIYFRLLIVIAVDNKLSWTEIRLTLLYMAGLWNLFAFLDTESSLSDDWERDFDDIDVTEDELAAAALEAKMKPANEKDDIDLDEWESWE